ncbi:hypothetical protein [Psychroflexus planctonicus]|uniref:DUF3887 domain-containing protein n=1 Tax=Psychroflexus planctonicus TaxID=1526575 RepID=A0ABQ1SE92_9FLAO|nr:hypothetical protein [Psychroflexus planctonicus]GGE26602.1 hypothetical protein GCM10010832_04120 [Psychroflexus planctonicus]
MKNKLFTLLIFITSFASYSQSFEDKTENDQKMAELFNLFYKHQNLNETVILNHGVDLGFIQQGYVKNFKVITKNETINHSSYLLFHTLDIEGNIGRIRYAIVSNNKKEEFKYLLYDMNTYKSIKK